MESAMIRQQTGVVICKSPHPPRLLAVKVLLTTAKQNKVFIFKLFFIGSLALRFVFSLLVPSL